MDLFSFWCLKKHNMSVFPFPRCVVVTQQIISWEIISKQYLKELYLLLIFFHWEIYNDHSYILVLCYTWVCHKCEVTTEMEQRYFLKWREEFGTAWQFTLPQLISGVSSVSAINVLVELAAAPWGSLKQITETHTQIARKRWMFPRTMCRKHWGRWKQPEEALKLIICKQWKKIAECDYFYS